MNTAFVRTCWTKTETMKESDKRKSFFRFFICFLFLSVLSDEGSTLEALDYTIRIYFTNGLLHITSNRTLFPSSTQ